MTRYYPARPARAPQPLPTRFDWMDDAPCAQSDPDLWDPDVSPDLTVARMICQGCPVIAACAVASVGESWGVWAGEVRWPSSQKRPKRVA